MYYFGSRNHFIKQNDIQKVLLAISGAVFSISTILLVIAYNWNSVAAKEIKTPIKHEPTETMVETFIPIRNIHIGQTITAELLEPRKVLPIQIQAGVVTSKEMLIGRYAQTDLVAGRFIYTDSLSSFPPTKDIRDQIPEGYTAVTIKVDKITSFHGWIEPGARVDISSITKIRGESAIVPLVNNVKIISVERRIEPQQSDKTSPPETITLIASPEEADKISLAQSTGLISLKLLGNHPSKSNPIRKPITEKDIRNENDQNSNETNTEGFITMDGKRYPIIAGRIVVTDN